MLKNELQFASGYSWFNFQHSRKAVLHEASYFSEEHGKHTVKKKSLFLMPTTLFCFT